MRGRKVWWIVMIAAVLLLVPACTENDLDESEADVILTVQPPMNTPPVQAGDVEGTCSGDASIECNNDLVCSDQVAGFCQFDSTSGCDPQDWSVTFVNTPLSAEAGDSELNGVTVIGLTITYEWPGGSVSDPLVIPIGQTIAVNQTGTITFPPIIRGNIAEDDTGVTLRFLWDAETITGNTVDIENTGGLLQVEPCLM